MSETLVQLPSSVSQSPAREVINVDDYTFTDDDDVDIQIVPRIGTPGGAHARHNRSREVIVVDDSDEEVHEVPNPRAPPIIRHRSGQTRRGTPHMRRRTLFSPSPPPQNNIVPPVPAIPRHMREPPLRWGPPPDFQGVFRPLDRPFAFENDLRVRPRTPDIQREPLVNPNPALREPPRRPSMGLGGALLALNRYNQLEAAHAQVPNVAPGMEHGNRNGWEFPALNAGFGVLRRLFNFDFGPGNPGPAEDEEDAALLEALALDAEEHRNDLRFRLQARPRGGRVPAGRLTIHDDLLRRRQLSPDYKQHFTHPQKPEPGFSNDFAPHDPITIAEGPGPSSAPSHEAGTIIVCAHCLDPLVMNVIGSEDVVRRSKLWALRCGHVLDGKCIDILMKPRPLSVPSAGEVFVDKAISSSSRKGKGKAEEEPTDLAGPSLCRGSSDAHASSAMNEDTLLKRNRGKRKAPPLDEDEYGATATLSRPDKKGKSRAHPQLPISTPATVPDQGGESLISIRSRLRPRHPVIDPSESTSNNHLQSSEHQGNVSEAPEGRIPAAPDTPSTRGRRGSGRGRGRRARSGATRGKGRARGKGREKAPVIEDTYYWTCPVAECGHKHKSIMIEGEWRMDEEEGGIAMYV